LYLCGLHVLDAAVIVLYVAVIIWIGKRVSRRAKSSDDFYIAGRKLGGFYQFFLNFGTSTNADQAVAVARETYRQGVGGMWIQFIVLFITPFYWFTTMFYRRCRLITIGDFYAERYDSRFLAAAYAVFALSMAAVGGGVCYTITAKMVLALTPKPQSAYTVAERAAVDQFQEYQHLKAEAAAGQLAPERQARYEELQNRDKRGELRSFISYFNQYAIYLVYAVIVGIYIGLGGFSAAAIADALQGFLILIFSIALIPMGLHRLGGFEGLHAAVPDYMFRLFGSAATSEYAWYTIAAMALVNLVSIVAVAPMMATAGSARNEMTARVGMIGGMFCKRVIMLFWALAGLLAIALYAGKLHDEDYIWGYMTRDLLFPGAIGLMLTGVLAATMSTLGTQAITNAALFVRNMYQPVAPNRSDAHYVAVGRVVIVVVLLGGILTAIYSANLLVLFKYFISVPAIFGASIWLGFVWRRVTKWAVIVQVLACSAMSIVIPTVFPLIDSIRSNPALLAQTETQTVTIVTGALEEDVAAGRAERVGQTIRRPHVTEPMGIFFEKVVRTDPADPNSPLIGQGRFQTELWLLSRCGIDFAGWSKAQLVAMRFLVDALLPFVLLFLASFVTRPVSKPVLDGFFAKVHTPVQPTPEAERAALAHAVANPTVYESRKLWRGSNWEIMKPSWLDVAGFGGSWVLVGVVLLLLWVMVLIGT
jgi:SSS family solute:Na+ symporter